MLDIDRLEGTDCFVADNDFELIQEIGSYTQTTFRLIENWLTENHQLGKDIYHRECMFWITASDGETFLPYIRITVHEQESGEFYLKLSIWELGETTEEMIIQQEARFTGIATIDGWIYGQTKAMLRGFQQAIRRK